MGAICFKSCKINTTHHRIGDIFLVKIILRICGAYAQPLILSDLWLHGPVWLCNVKSNEDANILSGYVEI